MFFKRHETNEMTGNRILNLEKLKDHVIEITMHSALCEQAKEIAKNGEMCFLFTKEKKRSGFYSIICGECKGCGKKFEMESSSFNTATNTSDITLRAVWGSISTGGGCSRLQEMCGTMNMPSLNQSAFTNIEQNIGNWWEGVFKEEIVKAGLEERRLAIERGDLNDGVPAITVICDGGWSKRSHKHSYNASGGVAVIFGAETKKLLYLGVRNKYCYMCESGKAKESHKCFKNWLDSSQSMESDMILEGFLEAESVNGVRYMRVIADGDSSVYAKVTENVPVWGAYVKQMECANQDQADFWNIASDAELIESRYAGQKTTEDIKNIIQDVSIFLNRLANKSERLIGNFTTNLAESWMNIRCKFDGGKVVNRCNRGSWQTRCFGGALRKFLGPAWSPLTYQKVTGDNPGQIFFNTFRKKSKHLITSLKTQKQEKAVNQRRKRKQKSLTTLTKKAKLDYGPSVLNDTADVSTEKLKILKEHFYNKIVSKNKSEIHQLEKETKGQNLCEKWLRQRKIRLTSSNFGKIIKRRLSNNTTNLVKNMLYSNFKGNIYTIRGLAQEKNTLVEYQNIEKQVTKVEKMGLMICEDMPFLGASTDGKVFEDNGNIGLIEIKNVLHDKRFSFKEASTTVPSFCLKASEDGKLHIKEDHEYYFQCQGQMNIFKLPWIDVVVRRTDPYEIHIERLYRDVNLWKTMVPKLEAFYHNFLLPELALPRYGTVTGIRRPENPWYEVQPQQKERQQKCTSLTAKETLQLNKQRHVTAIPLDTSTNQLSPKPSTSTDSQDQSTKTYLTRKRKVAQKFVGRRISHEWCLDEITQEKNWYKGTVLDVKKGKDGSPTAVYEFFYEGENESFDVDNLTEDFESGSLMFIYL